LRRGGFGLRSAVEGEDGIGPEGDGDKDGGTAGELGEAGEGAPTRRGKADGKGERGGGSGTGGAKGVAHFEGGFEFRFELGAARDEFVSQFLVIGIQGFPEQFFEFRREVWVHERRSPSASDWV
jgi:hypothetical protein